MIKNLKSNKAITLIALVITIVVLLILTAVIIRLVLKEDGIIGKAKAAALMQKKAQYMHEIDITVSDEQVERAATYKEEVFILSLKQKLTGKSNFKNVIICDDTGEENTEDASLNTIIIIETDDDFEIFVDVDNEDLTAVIRDKSFAKMEAKCKVKFDANGGTGTYNDIETRKGFYTSVPDNSPTREDYEFTGWCLDKNGEGTKYLEGNKIQIESDVTVYAT